MAYLSLYRKYRPQTFDEIVGQEAVSRTLANAISEDRVAHAYLFTGPRGTGKTSTARILAKALNCAKGPTPSPCGVCDSCLGIADGSSMDVIEMDAASHSKVDETRDILAGVPLATAGGRRKIYVIDEVHMLSTPSFNALLKTLEEPPSHVLFVLATTEAHKVMSTIVSRTQRFDFRRVPAELLQEHMAKLAKLEDIDIDADALALVARHADGGVRDALSVLDQMASFGGPISVEDVTTMLGERREDAFAELFDAIAAGDLGAVFGTLHSLVAEGADPRQLALGALAHTRSLLLVKTAPDAEGLLDVSVEDAPRLLEQTQRFTAGGLLRILDLLGKSLTEMRNVPNHRLLLELALVRAAAPETDPSADGLLGRIERLERRMGIAQGADGDVSVTPPTTSPRPAPQPGQAAAPVQPVEVPPAALAGAAEGAQVPDGAPEEPVAAVGVAVADGVGITHLRDAWPVILKEVNQRSKRVHALLNPSRVATLEDDVLVVEVQSDFHRSTMAQPRNRDLLTESLHAALGIRPRISFQAAGSPGGGPTAAAEVADLADTTPLQAGAHDPVELLKKGFGAEVVEETDTRGGGTRER
ncbi:DNA polymerase III subunit gamma/tau [soil metagenome]